MIDGVIYFIESEESRRIKIGFTGGDPVDRTRALQTGQPERLRILALVPGSLAVERQLHDRFAALAIGGEWFRRGADLAAFVDGVVLAQGQLRAAARQRPAARRAAPRAPKAAVMSRDELVAASGNLVELLRRKTS